MSGLELDENNNNKKSYEYTDVMELLVKALNSQSANKTNSFDMKKFSEAFQDLISTMVDTKGDRLKEMTDLTEYGLASLSVFSTLKDYYGLPSIDKFVDTYLKFRISKNRLGRGELLIISNMLNNLHSTDMISRNLAESGLAGNLPLQAGNVELPQNKGRKWFGLRKR